jgi:hypothetical protein
MQPLLTTLRLDLVPGYFSRDVVLDLFKRPAAEVTAFLEGNNAAGRLENFIAKASDTSDDLISLPQKEFWYGVVGFLRKPDDEYLSTASLMFDVIRAFADLFFKIGGDQKRSILLELIGQEEVEFTSMLLRLHIFEYGLFGHKRPSGTHQAFMDGPWVEDRARGIAKKHREQHLDGRFLWSLWELTPVYTMVDAGIWDDACRDRLNQFLADPHAVDALALHFYGAHFSTGYDMISKLTDLDKYLALVDDRLRATDINQSVRAALEKARAGFF